MVSCTIMVLLTDEIAQARFTDNKKPLISENIETTDQLVQGTSYHDATGSNAKPIASQTRRSSIVNELDQVAARWNFTDFNFARLHEYFVKNISNVAFIEATKAGGYSGIYALAQALVASKHCIIDTLNEAKFFVYSALKSLYDRCIECEREQMDGFHLLKQASKAMQSHQMGSAVYHEHELTPDYAKQMLSIYPYSFTLNDNITGLSLNNNLSDLISVINAYAEVSQKYNAPLPPMQAVRQPTVAELLQYFPGEHERVLAFLVAYPLETEVGEGYNPQRMSAETALKQQVSGSLRKLWDAATDDERNQVADMALYLFGMNPLAHTVHQVSVAQTTIPDKH